MTRACACCRPTSEEVVRKSREYSKRKMPV